MEYQWYPGHMTKARRMMEENVRIVDLVIELLDARVPVSSRNPDIDRLAAGKQRLIVLAKADLADPGITARFIRNYEAKELPVIAVDARKRTANNQLLQAIEASAQSRRERDRRRGIVNRPVRAMVCGIPNVGKSTLINSLSGRKGTKTGNRPGVTRGKQWISLGSVELLDTPGILWPKFDDTSVGVHLALIGSIRDEILDEQELAGELIRILGQRYPDAIRQRYEIAVPPPQGMAYNEQELAGILQQVAAGRRLLRTGGEPDLGRASHLLLDDFRSGRLGRITLDEIPSE